MYNCLRWSVMGKNEAMVVSVVASKTARLFEVVEASLQSYGSLAFARCSQVLLSVIVAKIYCGSQILRFSRSLWSAATYNIFLLQKLVSCIR